jgi:hypothetical protein
MAHELMKAFIYKRYGDPEVLQLVSSADWRLRVNQMCTHPTKVGCGRFRTSVGFSNANDLRKIRFLQQTREALEQ